MKAALVEQYHEPLAIRDIPEPAHDSDGVVVEVKACGVCRSDWHGWQGEWPGFTGGSLPHIFGHEFVGLVSDIGNNVSRYRVGDRVIVPLHIGLRSLRVLPERSFKRLPYRVHARFQL